MYNRLKDLVDQIEWAKSTCEAKGCMCESYQWLRAYKLDVRKLVEEVEKKDVSGPTEFNTLVIELPPNLG